MAGTPAELHGPAENFSMRLLTDPQPAIEWFCTGGSVCIGTEGEGDREIENVRDPRVPNTSMFKRPLRFPVAKGEA